MRLVAMHTKFEHYGGLAPSKIFVALVDSLKIF